ncbi:MAG: hypothetical protein QOK24_2027 [Verrucomicrobiota bacterium]|jgi:hypothetical protein
MHRIIFDLSALALLLTADYLLAAFAMHTGFVVTLGLPVAVGFSRGFAEWRYLSMIPYWVRGIEWTLVVIIEYAVACYIAVLLRPVDNFETVFGFGLLIILVPSVVFSLISFSLGFHIAKRLQVS